jgi:hypothetical protein
VEKPPSEKKPLEIPLIYLPHINQQIIHRSKARYRVVVAGRRFGKSALILNEAIDKSLQIKGHISWIILPLQKQAKEIYWIDPDITKYFMPYVRAGAMKIDNSELSLRVIKNDSWIRLKGSDNFDSLRGSGLDFIGWDEFADIKPEALDAIEPSLADSPNHRVIYGGTPKGLNHFHDHALRGNHTTKLPDFGKPIKLDPDYETFHFTSYDNAAWPEGSPERKSFLDFINRKKREAEERGKLPWFNQEYLASFERGAGVFFPQWHFSTHVIMQTIHPPHISEIVESMDWGISNPFCWLAHWIKKEYFGGKTFNRVYTFAEIYGTGKTPAQWVERINQLHQMFDIDPEAVSGMYLDNTMMSKVLDGSLPIATQFNDAFTNTIEKTFSMYGGSKDRIGRWSSMASWMTFAPDGKPYWIISKDCPNLIRTIPLMEPDENDIDDINTDLEDHAVDSASFALHHIPFIEAKVESVPRGGGVRSRRSTLEQDFEEWNEEE